MLPFPCQKGLKGTRHPSAPQLAEFHQHYQLGRVKCSPLTRFVFSTFDGHNPSLPPSGYFKEILHTEKMDTCSHMDIWKTSLSEWSQNCFNFRAMQLERAEFYHFPSAHPAVQHTAPVINKKVPQNHSLLPAHKSINPVWRSAAESRGLHGTFNSSRSCNFFPH